MSQIRALNGTKPTLCAILTQGFLSTARDDIYKNKATSRRPCVNSSHSGISFLTGTHSLLFSDTAMPLSRRWYVQKDHSLLDTAKENSNNGSSSLVRIPPSHRKQNQRGTVKIDLFISKPSPLTNNC